jgi:hypothetical protein
VMHTNKKKPTGVHGLKPHEASNAQDGRSPGGGER